MAEKKQRQQHRRQDSVTPMVTGTVCCVCRVCPLCVVCVCLCVCVRTCLRERVSVCERGLTALVHQLLVGLKWRCLEHCPSPRPITSIFSGLCLTPSARARANAHAHTHTRARKPRTPT